jgi:LysR family glycine cleavage system transcriptional activator
MDEARAALEDISLGLDRLENGLMKLRGRRAQALVVVTASQALVANWLILKLNDFSTRQPQIDVRLDVADRLIDIEHGEADIGIRCGLGIWPGLTATRLMGEEIIAVCSPSLVPKGPRPDAKWIAKQNLIHDTTPHIGSGLPDWAEWLSRAGASSRSKRGGLNINSELAVIQAAVAGRGIALVRKALVTQDLAARRLRHLMPEQRWPLKLAYYAVVSDASMHRPEVQIFHSWLLEQAASENRF